VSVFALFLIFYEKKEKYYAFILFFRISIHIIQNILEKTKSISHKKSEKNISLFIIK